MPTYIRTRLTWQSYFLTGLTARLVAWGRWFTRPGSISLASIEEA